MVPGLVDSRVERSAARHGHPQARARLLYRLAFALVLGFIIWIWLNSVHSLDSNQECCIGFGYTSGSVPHFLAYSRKLRNHRSSEGLHSFKPSRGNNLHVLIILAGDIEMNPGPKTECRLCKKYCKATDKYINCEECKIRFHASCTNLGESEMMDLESGNGSWYCTDCKADCG